MQANFAKSCIEYSEKTLSFAIQQIASNGKLTNYPDDLVCYYKLPYLLTIAGQRPLANEVLDYIKAIFFQKGNALSFAEKKTDNPLMAKFWGYVLGWIAIASQKSGRYDISYPLEQYLATFQSQDHGGFATSAPWGTDNAMDVITTAQCGRLMLTFGREKEAVKAGEFLGWNINQVSDKTLYLFTDNNKQPFKNFPSEAAMIHVVKQQEPNQAYFMIGLPCAFLIELYNATQNPQFLKYAKQYGDFALNCHESIKTFHFSHKIAWAMSLLYRATKEEKYLTLCETITHHLIKNQDNSGLWLKNEDAITSFDQSIEVATWLQEIAANLSEA